MLMIAIYSSHITPIYPDTNGRGLYGEMQDEPRNARIYEYGSGVDDTSSNCIKMTLQKSISWKQRVWDFFFTLLFLLSISKVY